MRGDYDATEINLGYPQRDQMQQNDEVVDGITGQTLLQTGVARLQPLRWKALRCCQRRQRYASSGSR